MFDAVGGYEVVVTVEIEGDCELCLTMFFSSRVSGSARSTMRTNLDRFSILLFELAEQSRSWTSTDE